MSCLSGFGSCKCYQQSPPEDDGNRPWAPWGPSGKLTFEWYQSFPVNIDSTITSESDPNGTKSIPGAYAMNCRVENNGISSYIVKAGAFDGVWAQTEWAKIRVRIVRPASTYPYILRETSLPWFDAPGMDDPTVLSGGSIEPYGPDWPSNEWVLYLGTFYPPLRETIVAGLIGVPKLDVAIQNPLENLMFGDTPDLESTPAVIGGSMIDFIFTPTTVSDSIEGEVKRIKSNPQLSVSNQRKVRVQNFGNNSSWQQDQEITVWDASPGAFEFVATFETGKIARYWTIDPNLFVANLFVYLGGSSLRVRVDLTDQNPNSI